MNLKIKKTILAASLFFGCLTIAISATAGFANSKLESAEAGSYSVTLNSSKTPAALTGEYQNTVSATITTANGNAIPLNFVLAKASSGYFVELANHGMIYNFGQELGRFTGITAITAVFSGDLKFYSSNAELVSGGAYLDNGQSLTSNNKYTLSSAARYFSLNAGDSGAVITSIKLDYTCDGSASTIPSGQTYYIEDFENYSADGQGWDKYASNHTITSTTNLRASFYSTYYGAENADPTDGANWTIMGSNDYLTYSSSKGRNGSKAGLFKTNSGNNFRYIQTKAVFGVPSVIGKGSTLSMWIHAPYTDKAGTTEANAPAKITLMAFYNAQFDMGGSNSATTTTYTIYPGSGWCEYTLVLDSTKNYYAFGIFIKKASTTLYVPVDDVTIYTTNPEPDTYIDGSFMEAIKIMSINMTTIFAFGGHHKSVVVRFANNYDAGVTGYSYNTSTKKFTINTNGSYSGYTYGTITGTYDQANNRLTGVGLDGSIKSRVTNNNNITVPQTTRFWNCDGTTAQLQSTFLRRYDNGGGWVKDTTNADRIVSIQYNRVGGTNSLKLRTFSGGKSTLNLNSDISVSNIKNIGFWIFNSSSSDVTVRLFYYTGANFTSGSEIGSVTATAKGWTFCCMGFSSAVTLRNFQLYFENVDTSIEILIDNICLYK